MIFVKHIENHSELKEELLDIIESMKAHYDLQMPKNFEKMSKSKDGYRSSGDIKYADYYNEKFKDNLPYRELVQDNMDPYMKQIADEFHCKSWTYKSMWYHEYHKGDSFDWHNHQNSHMTCVYYLDLPENVQGTEILDHDVDVKEGDVIIFPSILAHMSPQIHTDNIKKVIAWVMNFHYEDRNL